MLFLYNIIILIIVVFSPIIISYRILKDKEGQFIIFGLNPMVEKIINISQLDTVFNIFNSEDDALNNLI